jgi:hypothetical protein
MSSSFGNVLDWKGIREKTGDVNSMKAYITDDKDFLFNSQWVLSYFTYIVITLAHSAFNHGTESVWEFLPYEEPKIYYSSQEPTTGSCFQVHIYTGRLF